jgi:hypothetical protein
MTTKIPVETTIAVQHSKIELAQSFETARQAFVRESQPDPPPDSMPQPVVATVCYDVLQFDL